MYINSDVNNQYSELWISISKQWISINCEWIRWL